MEVVAAEDGVRSARAELNRITGVTSEARRRPLCPRGAEPTITEAPERQTESALPARS
ncbi:hypothetical protein SLA_7116 [Streptomyces laurentii]|uniref:Uncharacterized protein n=1 Tax=Streptomyces laurentii TaxID=39478 RepID=A0A169PIJ7_STRLU|nr:hypothetical protein SLA_7116 [Streptomyces laurentii]